MNIAPSDRLRTPTENHRIVKQSVDSTSWTSLSPLKKSNKKNEISAVATVLFNPNGQNGDEHERNVSNLEEGDNAVPDGDDDKDVVTYGCDDASTKFGRRTSNQFKPFALNEEETTVLATTTLEVDLANAFDAICNASKRNSAKYGRRSNIASRSSSIVTDGGDGTSQTFSSNCKAQVSDKDLLRVLEEHVGSDAAASSCSSSSKNSAKYGRRAATTTTTSRNNSLIYLDDGKPLIQAPETNSNFDHKSSRFDYANKTLEESWSSLKIFNKKQKGRIYQTANQVKHKDAATRNESTTWTICSVAPKPAMPPGSEPQLHSAIEQSQLQLELERESNDFVIPELPRGNRLTFDITTTWGDKHYVGLNGIELFNAEGEQIEVKQISADPADINVLPEYDKDPRVIKNLLNNVNRTHDDMHLWLTPFTPGAHHYIYITFHTIQSIAMIRIWNYNKSRIHSYRGVKDVHVSLDDVCIFRGEIARASGEIQAPLNAFGDTILYTLNEEILQKLAENDRSYETMVNSSTHVQELHSPEYHTSRPLTIDMGKQDFRPLTHAAAPTPAPAPAPALAAAPVPSDTQSPIGWKAQPVAAGDGNCTSSALCEKFLSISILNVWNENSPYVGMTGLEVIGETGVAVHVATIECSIQSDRIHNLLNKNNLTDDDTEMWLAPFQDLPVTITLRFSNPVHLSALTIWNYNASPELSYCGVCRIVYIMCTTTLHNLSHLRSNKIMYST